MPLDLSRFPSLTKSRRPSRPSRADPGCRPHNRALPGAAHGARGGLGCPVAAEVLGAYQRLGEEEVEWFFDRLVKALVDAAAVRQAAAAYRLDASPANLLALQEASNRHARSCSGAATWHREARPSWWNASAAVAHAR